jgi:hypothetical protein
LSYNRSLIFVLRDFIDIRIMEEIHSELVKYFGKFFQLNIENGFETFFMEIIEFVKIVDVVHQNSTSKTKIIRKLEFINEIRNTIRKELNDVVGFEFAAVTEHMFYFRNFFEFIKAKLNQSTIDSSFKVVAIHYFDFVRDKIDHSINFEYYVSKSSASTESL